MLSQRTGRSALPQESPRVVWWWNRILGSWALCWPRKWQGGGQVRDDSAPLQQRDRVKSPQFSPRMSSPRKCTIQKKAWKLTRMGVHPGGALCASLAGSSTHKAGFSMHRISICGLHQPDVELQGGLKECCIMAPIIYLCSQGLFHLFCHYIEPEHLNTENRGREGNREVNAGMEETQSFGKQNVAI